MDKEKLIEEYKSMILKGLSEHEVISEELYDKCSKPHISGLPYDNRTNDPVKLDERKSAIEEEIKKSEQDIKDLQKENDSLEKDIYKLDKEIEESDKKLEDLNDEIQAELSNSYDRVESAQDDIIREYGTEQDSRDEWFNQNIGDEFDYINQEIGRISSDIDDVFSKLFDGNTISRDTDSVSQEYNPNLNASRKDLEDLINYMENIPVTDDSPYAIVNGISGLRNVRDSLSYVQDRFADFDDENKNNKKLTSDRDNLQNTVDKNNKEIGKIESIINDYHDELDKI